jgi:hypothetical protein
LGETKTESRSQNPEVRMGAVQQAPAGSFWILAPGS